MESTEEKINNQLEFNLSALCHQIFSLREENKYPSLYGYRKCDTHARVLSQTVSHMYSNNEIKHRKREKRARRNERIQKEEQRAGKQVSRRLTVPGGSQLLEQWMNYLMKLTYFYNSSSAPWVEKGITFNLWFLQFIPC